METTIRFDSPYFYLDGLEEMISELRVLSELDPSQDSQELIDSKGGTNVQRVITVGNYKGPSWSYFVLYYFNSSKNPREMTPTEIYERHDVKVLQS